MPTIDAAAAAVADQRTALDPSTDPRVLAAIAQDRPDLRAAVAMNPVTATITVGDENNDVAVDEAAHTAYVTNAGDGTVTVIDTTTNQVTNTITVGDRPGGVAVDPTTGTVYVTHGDGKVSVLQAP